MILPILKKNQISEIGHKLLHSETPKELIVFPNPASESIMIYSQDLSQTEIHYEIMDLTNKTKLKGTLDDNIINISQLEKGVYLLLLTIDNKTFYKKIMII